MKGGEKHMDEAQQTNTSGPGSPLIIGAVIALLAIVGIGTFVMGNRNKASEQQANVAPFPETTSMQSPPDTAMPIATDTGAAEMEVVQEITVEAGSFYFEPAEIRVKKGDRVKIVLNSVDMMHDFTIDELEVEMDEPVKADETGTVEFTASDEGEFEYYCSVGQHRANGQVGTLIVEE